MLRVGLTGNIASGKSHAAHLFTEFGACVIDADTVAHEILGPETETYRRVVEAFGESILNPDSTIDRRALGQVVFASGEKRELLNSLVHPDVRAEIARRVQEFEAAHPHGIVIVDAALMVESGSYRSYDKLVVVHCPPQLQLARLINRDGLSVAEASARIAAQLPAEEKIKLADYTIDTSGTLRQTREQTERIYRALVVEEQRRGSGLTI